jgi:hypothetical protein
LFPFLSGKTMEEWLEAADLDGPDPEDALMAGE